MSAHVIIGACRLGMVSRTGIISSPLPRWRGALRRAPRPVHRAHLWGQHVLPPRPHDTIDPQRSEEHTSELQSRLHLVCRLLLEKKKKKKTQLIKTNHKEVR